MTITLKGMSWNYRVLAHEYHDELFFAIHEVYYNEDGTPDGCTQNAIGVAGENPDGLKWTLNRMKEALKKPVLWGGDRFPQEYEHNS